MVVKPSSHVALRRKIGLIWVIRSANAHWATPPFSERCSSLLKRVRFGYGSLINLFSTTLSIQANSRVQSLTVSAKRKPVHSFHRDVTTKSERVIAHVIGSTSSGAEAEGEPGRFCHMTSVIQRHPYIRYRRGRTGLLFHGSSSG